jgi:omega-amidase
LTICDLIDIPAPPGLDSVRTFTDLILLDMLIRVAQIKVIPIRGDLDANHVRLIDILRRVADHRPDVVVTPECFLDGYVSTESWVTKENIIEYAIDPRDSIYTRAVADWSAQTHSWFILGCTRASSEGAYNTALVFDRAGNLVGCYDKTHCQDNDRKYLPGRDIPFFESDFGRFGVLICADRRWPETVRTLALKGARLIINPTYGMHDERNLHMMETRSYESEIFIVFTHPSQALVIGPKGQIICNEVSEEKTYTVNEIDLSEVDAVRSGEFSHLKDRRPDLYRL